MSRSTSSVQYIDEDDTQSDQSQPFAEAGKMLISGSRNPTSISAEYHDDDDAAVEEYGEEEEGAYEEEENESDEPKELTEDIAATALSNLGHNPDGELVYTTMSLASLGLSGIDLLGIQFNHIQTLVLDRNGLTSLAPLAALTSLTSLSVAHNNLDAAGVFEALGGGGSRSGGAARRPYEYLPASSVAYSPLSTLRKLVLHHNRIECLDGLKRFVNCSHVDVGHNALEGTIQEDAINNMPALRYLNLSHNSISDMDAWALENTGLWELDISHNNLSACAFVAMLQPTLVHLNLAGNSLMHFDSIAGLHRLATLDLSNNNAYELAEVLHLQDCPSLRYLHLTGNPAFVDTVVGAGGVSAQNATATIQHLVSTGGYNAKRGIGSGVEGEDDDDVDDGVAVDPAEAQQALKRAAGGEAEETMATSSGMRRRSSGGGRMGGASTRNNNITASSSATTAPSSTVLSPLETLRRKQRQECKSTGNAFNGSLLKSHTQKTITGGSTKGAASTITAAPSSIDATLHVDATPDEEDLTELNSMPPARQSRLRVLWRLPSLLELDAVRVTPGELALAQCLEGGVDRHQRQEAKERAFGISNHSVNNNSGGGGNGGVSSLSGSGIGGGKSSAVGGGRSAIAQLRQLR